MMRWNGIGRATDGRTSSCTSLASSSDSKEKETGDDDGDGERKKEEEKQKEREGLDGGGMIRKFFSTPIEAVRSFARCWEHKLDRDGSGGGRRTMEWRLSLELCDRSGGFISAVCSRWLRGLSQRQR